MKHIFLTVILVFGLTACASGGIIENEVGTDTGSDYNGQQYELTASFQIGPTLSTEEYRYQASLDSSSEIPQYEDPDRFDVTDLEFTHTLFLDQPDDENMMVDTRTEAVQAYMGELYGNGVTLSSEELKSLTDQKLLAGSVLRHELTAAARDSASMGVDRYEPSTIEVVSDVITHRNADPTNEFHCNWIDTRKVDDGYTLFMTAQYDLGDECQFLVGGQLEGERSTCGLTTPVVFEVNVTDTDSVELRIYDEGEPEYVQLACPSPATI